MDAAQTERPPAPVPETGLAGYFKFAERGTDLVTEARAGLTTFMVMAYIIFLNPAILSAAGHRRPGGRPPATALVAGIMTIAMGLVVELPVRAGGGSRDQRDRGVRARPDPRPDACRGRWA